MIYAPALGINLLSGFQLRKHKFCVVIDEEFYIQKRDKILAELIPQNNLFFVDLAGLTANVAKTKEMPKPRPKLLRLWH